MSKKKFVNPLEKTAISSIPVYDITVGANDARIMVEQGATFNLLDYRKAIADTIASMTKEGVSEKDIVRAFCTHFIFSGSSRALDTSGFNVSINDIEVSFQPVSTSMRVVSKTQYDDSTRTINTGKLFQRCYALDVLIVNLELIASTDQKGGVFSHNKIASKLQLGIKDAILCISCAPDALKFSSADGKRFLRIMAAYMQRSRSGKNKKDVRDAVIDVESIFASLCQRVSQNHPKVGFIAAEEIKEMWKNPNLRSSDQADLSSIINTQGEGTLGELARDFKVAYDK